MEVVTIDDSYAQVCVPNKVKNMSVWIWAVNQISMFENSAWYVFNYARLCSGILIICA